MSVSYRTANELARMILAQPDVATRSFAVIDVRDSDYNGGHLPGAVNIPSHVFSLRSEVAALVKRFRDKKEVVFHCMMSQQRGPTCARIFLEQLNKDIKDEEQRPDVTILEGGFYNWARSFASKPEGLFEDFNQEKWKS